MRWPSWLRRGDPEEAEHLKLGRRGEKLAVRHLKRNGYRVLARNWRCKHDELDVVARRDDLLVVVEVKTRRDTTFGRPADAVDREKRRRLSRAGLAYVKRLRAKPRALRFDIIEVVWPADGTPEIRHLENAFTSEGGGRAQW